MTKPTVLPLAEPTKYELYAPAACRVPCAGGNKCVSSNYYAHVYHICKDELCKCHELLRQGRTE